MDILGCQYPIVKTPRGLLPTVYGTEAVKADLMQLLLTNPGERVMLPDYGTPLRALLFEQSNPLFAQRVRNVIIAAINLWEPRVVVLAIDIVDPQGNTGDAAILTNTDSNSFYVNIKFALPEKLQAVDQLVLEIPLGE
jgi:phage baseplate assembly protein W